MDQKFSGLHITFGFHGTSEANVQHIMHSEGIFPGGPNQDPPKHYRDCVYCSCNDPSGTPINPIAKSAILVSHSSTRFVAGLMMLIPVHKYLQSGCMIQIDFVSFQCDHPHVTCYVTAANCLMIPHLVSNRYFI